MRPVCRCGYFACSARENRRASSSCDPSTRRRVPSDALRLSQQVIGRSTRKNRHGSSIFDPHKHRQAFSNALHLSQQVFRAQPPKDSQVPHSTKPRSGGYTRRLLSPYAPSMPRSRLLPQQRISQRRALALSLCTWHGHPRGRLPACWSSAEFHRNHRSSPVQRFGISTRRLRLGSAIANPTSTAFRVSRTISKRILARF